MYIKFPCTKCGKTLKAREEHVGQKARCPYCQTSVAVPEPPPAPSPFTPAAGATTVGAPAPPPRGPRERTDGASVSMLWSALIGFGMTVVWLGLLYPIQNSYFGALFLQRGFIPPVEVFCFCWALGILFLKFRQLRSQQASMLFDLLPSELSDEISPATVDKFVAHVRSLPAPGDSFLVNRVTRCLEHFRVRKSNPEVATLLASQSDIDANAVTASYAIIKVTIWAIPILGFIGTVIGMSDAVSSLSGGLSGSASIDELKNQLGGITSGLGVAFDTTLVALVMSLILSYLSSSLQTAEEDLLNNVDDYCNENLLVRLKDGASTATALGSADLEKALTASLAAQRAVYGKAEESISQIVEQFKRSLDAAADRTEKLQGQLAAVLKEDMKTLRLEINGIERGLSSLNDVLGQLGQKQVVVQLQPPPSRLWSFFRRTSNGTASHG